MRFSCLWMVFVLCFLEKSYGQTNKEIELIKTIQGKWVSVDDKYYKIIIFGDTIKECYSGEKPIYYTYEIASKNCDAEAKVADSACLYLIKKEIKTNATYSYLVSFTSKEFLEMIYEGGKIISFKRKNSQ